jgi:TonB family protein
MKFRSLNFAVIGIITLLNVSITACNSETGNNSTTSGNESDSAGAPNSTTSKSTSADTSKTTMGKTMKKVGKASVKMVADAGAKVEKDKMGYYTNTEVAPGYNGGQSALENYINDNIQYPEQAIDNNAAGTVNVHFLIDEKGNVSNVTTTGDKIGYGLEEEAVRVVSKMPKWTPGQVKGKNVKTWRTLPITYRLEES